jgi:hypothetical protein
MNKITLYLMILLALPAMLTAQFKGGNYGGAVATLLNNSPLPVQLASFTSTINSRNVILNWVTASEQNNSGFEVQRAVFGSEFLVFSKMAFVSGKGTTNTPTSYTFEDKNLQTGKYQYRLKQTDNNGNFAYFALNGIAEVGIPAKFDISQNYPNPFNPVTKINFDLPEDTKVNITVFDLTGREIKTIVNEFRTAGYYTVQFDASGVSSGVYFYRIMTGGSNKFVMTKKLVVVK